jgi:hypothetical protein
MLTAVLHTQILSTANLKAGKQYQVCIRTEEQQLTVLPNVATEVVPISSWLSAKYGGDVAAVLKHW